MGQRQSSQIQEFVFPFISQILSEENVPTLMTEEIHTLSYERFIASLGELNVLSKQCLDSEGKQLVFAVKKGTDSTLFWKATVQIACVKIHPQTQKVDSYRLLNLSEFLKVFKTLTCQSSAVKQSKGSCSESRAEATAMKVIRELSEENAGESSKECCICLERQHEVILPCAHSYCLTCIEEWSETHDTCPICREKLESTDDTWVLSEVPKAEEISKEMRSNLMELTEDRSPTCTPS